MNFPRKGPDRRPPKGGHEPPINDRGIRALPNYDIDEEALELGTVAMANVLIEYLETHPAD